MLAFKPACESCGTALPPESPLAPETARQYWQDVSRGLDTLQGSQAEQVYGHLGWQRAGEVPDYAAAPDGELFPTVIFFKRL